MAAATILVFSPVTATPRAATTRMGHAESATHQSAKSGAKAAQTRLGITFRGQPDPPKTGDNRFEVTVKGPDGRPIANAEVSVVFPMAVMPSMNMPAMRNEVKLTSAAGGKYTGAGNVMMGGKWDVTVLVKQKGKDLGSKKLTVVAKWQDRRVRPDRRGAASTSRMPQG